jgi:hypothetical protein
MSLRLDTRAASKSAMMGVGRGSLPPAAAARDRGMGKSTRTTTMREVISEVIVQQVRIGMA